MTTDTRAARFASMMESRLQEGVNFFTAETPGYWDVATGVKARHRRRPAGVFFATCESDVVTAVRSAISIGLSVVPRGGGHSYEVLSSMDDALVIDLADMNTVALIEENPSDQTGTATVEGGARIGHLFCELDKLGGYSFCAGTCPGVGIGGLISGGGYGIESRKYGLAADHVLAMRVVLADGELVTVTSSQHGDLFWALRGGGAGSFGVITEFTIRVYKVPVATVFKIKWKGETAMREGLRRWMDYFPIADKRVTTQLSLENDTVLLNGQFIGERTELDRVLEEAGVSQIPGKISDFRTDAYSGVSTKAYMWGDTFDDLSVLHVPKRIPPEQKDFAKLKGAYASTKLPDEGVNIAVEMALSAPRSTWSFIQFEAYGGVFSSQTSDMTPWPHRQAVFSMQWGVGLEEGELRTSEPYQWTLQTGAKLNPFLNGMAYQNYCDLELGSTFGEKYWGKENFARLRQIKRQYDPNNFFRSAQSIPLPET